VINSACKQAGEWHRAGHDIRIGINLASSLFHTHDLPGIVAGALKAATIPPSLIELEVTEGIIFEDNEKTAAILREIRQAGVAIAFDDFGTGHASLTHLKRFPLDRLKIDQSFVRDLTRHQDDGAIVSTLVGLGKLLNLHVTAEGIEDRETADALVLMGCGEGQGYYFGRPVPAQEFTRKYLLASGSDLQPVAASDEIVSAA
jgi:EAL domain-containing protein (putative c-di-GMP-specific phosphodiesterase class I)